MRPCSYHLKTTCWCSIPWPPDPKKEQVQKYCTVHTPMRRSGLYVDCVPHSSVHGGTKQGTEYLPALDRHLPAQHWLLQAGEQPPCRCGNMRMLGNQIMQMFAVGKHQTAYHGVYVAIVADERLHQQQTRHAGYPRKQNSIHSPRTINEACGDSSPALTLLSTSDIFVGYKVSSWGWNYQSRMLVYKDCLGTRTPPSTWYKLLGTPGSLSPTSRLSRSDQRSYCAEHFRVLSTARWLRR